MNRTNQENPLGQDIRIDIGEDIITPKIKTSFRKKIQESMEFANERFIAKEIEKSLVKSIDEHLSYAIDNFIDRNFSKLFEPLIEDAIKKIINKKLKP